MKAIRLLFALLLMTTACSDDNNGVAACSDDFLKHTVGLNMACPSLVNAQAETEGEFMLLMRNMSKEEQDNCYTFLIDMTQAYPNSFNCVVPQDYAPGTSAADRTIPYDVNEFQDAEAFLRSIGATYLINYTNRTLSQIDIGSSSGNTGTVVNPRPPFGEACSSELVTAYEDQQYYCFENYDPTRCVDASERLENESSRISGSCTLPDGREHYASEF